MAERVAKKVKSTGPATITGLVDARGHTCTKPPGARRWTMRFTFKAWRQGIGPIVHKPLAVECALTNAQWVPGMRTVGPNTIVRIIPATTPVLMARTARVVAKRIEGRAADAALGGTQSSHEVPATVVDPVLGRLKRSEGSWPSLDGDARFHGRRVRVHVQGPTKPLFLKALRHTHALWRRQDAWLEAIRPAVIKHWLKEANGPWRLDGDRELTAEAFWKRLRPTDLSINAAGRVWLDLAAGDLFGGHAIVVIASVSGCVREFDLVG